MPRVVDGSSDPIDFCKRHFPSAAHARKLYGAGEGPDARGNCFEHNAEHPPYAGEGYRCDQCGAILTDEDD